MVGKLFSNKPDPEVQALLQTLIPPEVGEASEEAIEQASGPRGSGMLDLLGFEGFSLMDAVLGRTGMTTTRHGREVTVFFGMTGMGKPTVTTHVAVSAAPFEVSDKDKNLETLSLPSGIAEALQGFGPLDKGVRVEGNTEGITVERKRSSKDAASAKGNVQWLTDLRLAESLADAIA